MKKLLIILGVSSLLFSELINGVAIVVGKKPITLYEIEKTMKEEKISKTEAVDILINKKIELEKIEELGIRVSDYELDERIKFVAKQNNMGVSELRQVLEARFIGWSSYKEKIKEGILNEKLSREVLSNELVSVDENDGKIYYEQNLEKYNQPTSVKVVKYISDSRSELEATIKNPMRVSRRVQSEKETVKLSTTPPQIAAIISTTKERKFTPILPIGGNFLAIFVEKKLDTKQRSYQEVKGQILEELNSKNREKAVESYFKKARSSIKITYIR
ncbi:MAG: SurA N-terminal domain-containing protein [Campylobacterales bacterium]|nr:SurA N-terminal domain-containing protein [Campylobacterales bacterium]